jgi:hypothetical protein
MEEDIKLDLVKVQHIEAEEQQNTISYIRGNECEYSTSFKSALNQHEKTVHCRVKNQMCDRCQYSASDPRTLYNHQKAVHYKNKGQKCNEFEYSQQPLMLHSNKTRNQPIAKLKIRYVINANIQQLGKVICTDIRRWSIIRSRITSAINVNTNAMNVNIQQPSNVH